MKQTALLEAVTALRKKFEMYRTTRYDEVFMRRKFPTCTCSWPTRSTTPPSLKLSPSPRTRSRATKLMRKAVLDAASRQKRAAVLQGRGTDFASGAERGREIGAGLGRGSRTRDVDTSRNHRHSLLCRLQPRCILAWPLRPCGSWRPRSETIAPRTRSGKTTFWNSRPMIAGHVKPKMAGATMDAGVTRFPAQSCRYRYVTWPR